MPRLFGTPVEILLLPAFFRENLSATYNKLKIPVINKFFLAWKANFFFKSETLFLITTLKQKKKKK